MDNNLENTINKQMKIPLSAEQVMNFSGCSRILKYRDLLKIKHYTELFDRNGKCLLLFELKNNFGHWVCIILNKKNIYFFDSYGTFPDKELEYIPQKYKKQSGQDYANLSALFDIAMKDGYTLDYNANKLQDDSTNVCGRWCAMRMINNHLDNDSFSTYYIKKSNRMGKTPDFVVTYDTLDI